MKININGARKKRQEKKDEKKGQAMVIKSEIWQAMQQVSVQPPVSD